MSLKPTQGLAPRAHRPSRAASSRRLRAVGGLVAALACAAALHASSAAAQSCAMLPPGAAPEGPPAPAADREAAAHAAASALTSEGLTVIPTEDAQRRLSGQPFEECADIDCAPRVVEALGVDFVVLVTVWAPRGRPTTVVVTFVGASGSAAGDAPVEGDVAGAVRAALTIARQRWQTGQMGYLVVSSEPTGATVELDGRAIGQTPLRQLAMAGERQLRVVLDDHVAFERTVVIHPGQERSVEATLAPVVDEPTLPVTREEPHFVNWIIGGGLALGGVALLVSPIHTLARLGECEETTGGLCTRGVRFGAQSGVLLGLGLAALTAGIVWVIAQPITATVEVSPDSAGLRLQGMF